MSDNEYLKVIHDILSEFVTSMPWEDAKEVFIGIDHSPDEIAEALERFAEEVREDPICSLKDLGDDDDESEEEEEL